MNFVVIMNDTLRADHLAAYGNSWCKTPSSKAFAEKAAVFDNCWVGSFPTIPNRTDLFTGRYGEPLHPWLPLDYGETTLPRILSENGYVTQLVCDTPHLIQGGHNFDYPFHAWQIVRGSEVDRFGMDSDPVEFPFKDFSKVNPRSTNRTTAQWIRNTRHRIHEEDFTNYQTYRTAANWIHRNAKQKKFFLWVDSFDPHEPAAAPRHYVDLYDPGYKGDEFLNHVRLERLTEAEIKNCKARYAASVTFVDRNVGRLLQAIDDAGLADSTCVVWISDHGTHLAEHGALFSKRCFFDEVARTVLMVRFPGMATAGKHFADLVQPADLAPTLLELAEIPVPPRMQGKSYLPLLQGQAWKGREVAISGGNLGGATPEAMKANRIVARDARFVLVDSPNPALRELYDTRNDPGQTANAIREFAGEADRLHGAVLEFLKTHEAQPQIVRLFETGDPGDMTGYVARRPGMEHFQHYFTHLLNSECVPE